MSKVFANVDVVDAMRKVTVHVRIKRGTELAWRIWLGMRLISLAARVMNCNIQYDEIEKVDTP